MPDLWAGVWAVDGLPWLVAITFVAGLVRGFSGFGTALIYMPVAAQFISPVWAIMTLALMDIAGPAPNLPKVWKDRHPSDLMRLFVGTLVGLPIGLALLLAVDPTLFRYAVSGLALAMLALLLSGYRYQGTIRPPMLYGIGGSAGFLGGIAGLPGPPVILLYMASLHGAAVIRANTMLFLMGYDILLIATLGVQGMMAGVPVLLGVLLTVPNMLGNLAGGAIFRPGYEKTYRSVAYAIIAASALSGLPIWS